MFESHSDNVTLLPVPCLMYPLHLFQLDLYLFGYGGHIASTKAGIDEDSPEQNFVTHHVVLENNSFQNNSFFSCSSQKNKEGL